MFERFLVKCFLLWEMILYIGFMVGDLWMMPWSNVTNEMKYLAVVSCVIYVWIGDGLLYKKYKSVKGIIGQPLDFALLYSVCADYFMLFTDEIGLGILGFGCVQICYYKSLKENRKQNDWEENDVVWVGMIFELAIFFILLGRESNFYENINQYYLIIISAICYMEFSIWNLVRVKRFLKRKSKIDWNNIIYITKEKKQVQVLFIGMLLLFAGDIYVGLNQFLPVVGPAMWLFYLPSQICIVIANQRKKQFFLEFVQL